MLTVSGLVLRRGGFRLEADFTAPVAGITVLFGPSGAGKSLLLSALAGLKRPEAGSVRLGEEMLDETATSRRVPAHRRGIGLAFQDARLFPHLSVRGNLDFARKRAPNGRPTPLDDVVEMLGLSDLLDRSARDLSGGERSRVALGRALLSSPRLLLLDEPFAALDGARRRSYLALLREVSKSRNLPMMVVTHSIEDAAELADHAVAIDRGLVVDHGSADQVLNGEALAGMLDRRDLGVRIAGARLGGDGRSGAGVWVRADAVMLATERPSGVSARHVWRGRILSLKAEPEEGVLVRMDTDVGIVLARVTEAAVSDLSLAPGQEAHALVKTHAL